LQQRFYLIVNYGGRQSVILAVHALYHGLAIAL